MREVFGAVIATALVLIAVFVPVAFFPGTTGRLYQQFALTIAFSVAISAFNALTLTPALSALLLRHDPSQAGAFFGALERVLHAGTDFYVRGVRGLMRARWAMAVIFVGLLGVTYLVNRVPSAFIPRKTPVLRLDRPGAARRIARVPAGVVKEAEKILLATPEVASVFSLLGFSFTGAGPNQGIVFTLLKPFDEREQRDQRIQALLPRLRGRCQHSGRARRPVRATRHQHRERRRLFDGGARSGRRRRERRGARQRRLCPRRRISELNPRRRSLQPVHRQRSAAFVDIDREKARSLGLPISEITNAMQIYLGSAYVNDFDFNNRAYRVYVQADKAYRSDPADLGQYYARTRGDMVPLASVVRVRETTAPQVITHFNLFRSAQVTGTAAPGVSFGQALTEMERLAGTALPQGRIRLVRDLARGNQGGRSVGRNLRHCAAARLPDARRAA